MKSTKRATANDAIRVGYLCWIEYASEWFAGKVIGVRLSSFKSIEYQVACPSLPDHCRQDWLVAGRVCDYVDDGKECFEEVETEVEEKAEEKQKKKRKSKPAWSRGIIKKSSSKLNSSKIIDEQQIEEDIDSKDAKATDPVQMNTSKIDFDNSLTLEELDLSNSRAPESKYPTRKTKNTSNEIKGFCPDAMEHMVKLVTEVSTFFNF